MADTEVMKQAIAHTVVKAAKGILLVISGEDKISILNKMIHQRS